MSENFKQIIADSYNVIVIGAGVVGCAMARKLTLEGASVLVVEKGADILDGASKGNSAILHTGFDAPPGSVEQASLEDSYQEYLGLHKNLKLPLLKTGALVMAWNDEQVSKLDAILSQAHTNGVKDAAMLSAKQILRRESKLSPTIKAAVHVPGEYVIDPWTTPYAYMLQAIENGARLLCSTEVLGGEFDGDSWRLTTNRGLIKGTIVINCAGLYGDRLDALLIKKTSFEIHPRKGQFIVYDKSASKLINSIILPVPTETTKGVVVVKTIFGNLMIGPTAEEQQSRVDASVDRETLKALQKKGEQLIPALKGVPVTATFAGIRPATQFKDYCINAYKEQGYISVGGIRSTGLSAALGIANYVFNLYTQLGKLHKPVTEISFPAQVPVLAESQVRDWQLEGNKGVICHCEWVTRREIDDALQGKMPVNSMDGLKRRTRVTMGRCQGFYCSAKLNELTQNCFSPKPTSENTNGTH